MRGLLSNSLAPQHSQRSRALVSTRSFAVAADAVAGEHPAHHPLDALQSSSIWVTSSPRIRRAPSP